MKLNQQLPYNCIRCNRGPSLTAEKGFFLMSLMIQVLYVSKFALGPGGLGPGALGPEGVSSWCRWWYKSCMSRNLSLLDCVVNDYQRQCCRGHFKGFCRRYWCWDSIQRFHAKGFMHVSSGLGLHACWKYGAWAHLRCNDLFEMKLCRWCELVLWHAF